MQPESCYAHLTLPWIVLYLMSVHFYPPADPSCAYCQGQTGYVVRPRGEFAVAELCVCIPECPRCGGTGRVAVRSEGVTRVGRCRCQMRTDRIRLFNGAEIPARHAKSSFMSFDIASDGAVIPAFGAARSWVEDFTPGEENQGLVLWGPVGRGKTHLLIATLRELVFKHGIQVRFVEFSRLLSILKEGYSSGRSDAPILSMLATIPVLGIDELGKGRLSEWELTIIDEVISRRYNAMGCMVGTTNYRPASPTGNSAPNLAMPEFEKQTLGDRVGWRVFSRLQQMCLFVQARGQDYRQLAGRSRRARLKPVGGQNVG